MQMKEDVTYNPGHSEQRTLADIREAIAECDALRLDPDLTAADRSSLERTAFTLRSVERELIEATSETVLDRLEAASKPLEDLARDIRTRVTAMNAPARTLEHFNISLHLELSVEIHNFVETIIQEPWDTRKRKMRAGGLQSRKLFTE